MFLRRNAKALLRFFRTEIGQYFLITVCVGSIALTVSITLIRTDFRNGLAEQRLNAIEDAEMIAQGVEETLASYGVLSESLAAIMSSQPEMSTSEFNGIADHIGRGFPEIMNVAAAPGLVVQYVYPFEPNQGAIGLDYRNDPVTYAAIQRARRSAQVTFDGPRSLVQGGDGIIVRTPVFVERTPGGDMGFWGVTAIVVELQAFLDASGVRDRGDSWQIAMRRVVSSDDLGEVFLGDPALFRAGAVTVPIRLEGLEWEIALAPVGGWATAAPNAAVIVALIASISLFLLAVSISFVRMFFDRERARTQLLLAIESIDGGFILFDKDDRLVLCNERYKDQHRDYAHVLAPGRRFSDIVRYAAAGAVAPDDNAAWVRDRIAQHQEPDGVSARLMRDGTWMKVSRQTTPDGGMVELSADITELKKAKLAAESANEAKTEFLHMVSHELRTPLTIILGFLAFLARPEKIPANVALRRKLIDQSTDAEGTGDLFDQSLASTADFAKRAEASGKHLLALISDILDLSKIESGEVTLAYEDLPVAEVLSEIDEQFTGLAGERGLELNVADSGLTVRADRLRLRQTLINLVGNAVKFTKTGGINVWADVAGGHIWFHVQDTGPGIAASDHSTVFERFKQLDTSSTRPEGGIGLGLSICKHLVDLHGGVIEVESELGTGTHFKFSVPIPEAILTAA